MRVVLAWSALLLGACLAPGCARGGPGGPARHLILISIDTLRPDRLSCYGHERATSPAIDGLAERGVRFADASSSAPWTLPAHATMFTGLYPSRHGVKDYSQKLPASARTLAEVLREQGFQTGAVVNTWNIADPRFEIFQGFAPDDVRYVRETRQEPGRGQVILNSGREVLEAAREWLARRDPARPFFLFLHLYDVHSDFAPEAEYRRRFVAPYAGKLDGTTSQLLAWRARAQPLEADDVRFLFDLYDAEIRQTDDLLAGFLAELEQQGLFSETLLALTSDHGEEFFEHGGLLHGRTQYQELLAVPLILAGPGLPRGVVVREPVSLVDLLPTLLGRFGIAPPQDLDGLDLAPTWTSGADPLPARALFGEADHNNVVDGRPVIDIKRMARLGSEKLLLDRHTGGSELYDLGLDPLERQDLSASRAGRVALLRAELARQLDGMVVPEESGTELSPENLDLLRELGYAGDEER